ncbi:MULTISPECIES: cysteine hydrolase [unclassified Mycobacterium]|uniref:cysteine hydrolase n=1 Tax=unclassified Mycobacterium TaxID=2642494 RepID=UPI0029C86644|nr:MULTISPECIES: cysteine hydrolase [unclassified Mycobacterium]
MASAKTASRLVLINLLIVLTVAACARTAPAPNPAATVTNTTGPSRLQAVDPAHTALLVMDMQRGLTSQTGSAGNALAARIAAAERASRNAGVMVGFVMTEFAPGYPDVSPNNKEFAPAVGSGKMIRGDPDTQLDPRIAPVGTEHVIVKHRIGAFSTDSLEQVLRARNINTLVLAGIATSGVVLSTVRVAADLDYRVIVLSDCVTDPDPEINRLLLEKVFPPQADVTDSDRYVAALAH